MSTEHNFFLVEGDHHAYLVRGSGRGVWSEIERTYGTGHPDLYQYRANKLTIEEAREIRGAQANRPVAAARTVFVIEVNEINHDAQHALLKVFEDPAPSTVFFLILPADAHVLPTLRSRVAEITIDSGSTVGQVDAASFLASAPADRISQVSDIIKEKDKQQARLLLDGCELIMHQRWHEHETDLTEPLEELIQTKEYLGQQGASVKLLLEHMSLVLPQMKNHD